MSAIATVPASTPAASAAATFGVGAASARRSRIAKGMRISAMSLLECGKRTNAIGPCGQPCRTQPKPRVRRVAWRPALLALGLFLVARDGAEAEAARAEAVAARRVLLRLAAFGAARGDAHAAG